MLGLERGGGITRGWRQDEERKKEEKNPVLGRTRRGFRGCWQILEICMLISRPGKISKLRCWNGYWPLVWTRILILICIETIQSSSSPFSIAISCFVSRHGKSLTGIHRTPGPELICPELSLRPNGHHIRSIVIDIRGSRIRYRSPKSKHQQLHFRSIARTTRKSNPLNFARVAKPINL